jgi:hypothetical protein
MALLSPQNNAFVGGMTPLIFDPPIHDLSG